MKANKTPGNMWLKNIFLSYVILHFPVLHWYMPLYVEPSHKTNLLGFVKEYPRNWFCVLPLFCSLLPGSTSIDILLKLRSQQLSSEVLLLKIHSSGWQLMDLSQKHPSYWFYVMTLHISCISCRYKGIKI